MLRLDRCPARYQLLGGRGEIFGILGPNAAGKTTTVECVIGLKRRDHGTVQTLGVDPERERATIPAQVGVELQQADLPERMTVAEAVRLFASFYPRPARAAELITLGLTGGDVPISGRCRVESGSDCRLCWHWPRGADAT